MANGKNDQKNKKKNSGKGSDHRGDPKSAKGGNRSTDKNQKGKDVRGKKGAFSEQYLPYIFGAIAIFLMVCFVLDAIGGATEPTEHMMGVFGYYICYFLFGCFSWVAYLIPALLVTLAILWKRSHSDGTVVLKVVLSVLFMILLPAFFHVILCAGDESLSENYNPVDLYSLAAGADGSRFLSGGVLGGLLGNLLYLALKLPGTIVLAVLTLPLLVMSLVGVTPAFVFGKIAEQYRVAKENRASDDEEDEDEDKPRRSRRRSRNEDDDDDDSLFDDMD